MKFFYKKNIDEDSITIFNPNERQDSIKGIALYSLVENLVQFECFTIYINGIKHSQPMLDIEPSQRRKGFMTIQFDLGTNASEEFDDEDLDNSCCFRITGLKGFEYVSYITEGEYDNKPLACFYVAGLAYSPDENNSINFLEDKIKKQNGIN